MKKQFNNELINTNNLNPGKTGNADLDNAISNVKEEPLIFSVEEANYLVENAMTNDVTSSVIKNTIIIGGAVLLSAVFGWMYYEFNHEAKSNQNITTSLNSNSSIVGNERNKIKLSSNSSEFSDSTTSAQLNENTADVNPTEVNNNNIAPTLTSNNITTTSNKIANSTVNTTVNTTVHTEKV
jgi:hypothetical protein